MAISEETFFLDPAFEGTLQKQNPDDGGRGHPCRVAFGPERNCRQAADLARHLGISRITVTLAYTELQADDYVVSSGRSGYFVSDTAPQPRMKGSGCHGAIPWIGPGSSVRGFPACARSRSRANWQSYRYPFIYGQADPTLFDHANWRFVRFRRWGSAISTR